MCKYVAKSRSRRKSIIISHWTSSNCSPSDRNTNNSNLKGALFPQRRTLNEELLSWLLLFYIIFIVIFLLFNPFSTLKWFRKYSPSTSVYVVFNLPLWLSVLVNVYFKLITIMSVGSVYIIAIRNSDIIFS